MPHPVDTTGGNQHIARATTLHPLAAEIATPYRDKSKR
jgi:hypothetical protein